MVTDGTAQGTEAGKKGRREVPYKGTGALSLTLETRKSLSEFMEKIFMKTQTL